MKFGGILGVIIAITVVLNSKGQDLVPLSLGNYWVYEEVTFVNGEEQSPDTITNSVISKHRINNIDWYYIYEFKGYFTVRNTLNGHVELDSFRVNWQGLFQEKYIFRKPKGHIQKYMYNEDTEVVIAKKTTKVKVPKGKFKAYKYDLISLVPERYVVSEFYIVPGIGIVYQVWTEGNKIIEHRLLDYHLSP